MTNTEPPLPALVDAAPLTLTLFGPMQVSVGGRPIPRLRSRKALWLLALLVLRGGRPVEREWLAGALWPDADPDQALASLRTVLSELRTAIGGEGVRLRSPSRHSLLIDLAGADVDVTAFDTAVADGRLPALARAAALYRGPLLEGCAEEWVGQERAAREQDCIQVLQTLADAALAAGDVDTAAGHYRRAVTLDPWREAARRGLMEALARGGDTNAAFQVYREFVTLLRDDPKAVPAPETSALYSRLRAEARRQATEGGPPPVAARADAAAPAVSGYLPHPLTDLVGREDERLEVAAKLRRSRLVTLTGPGGIGKTRLALAVAGEAAPDFTDGVWLVPLEALSDGAQVAAQAAASLGLKEVTSQPPLQSLTDHLRLKRLLLVLDNCEHLLEASAQLVGHLLRECAGLRVLATSRAALGVTGETAWTVPGLAVPDPAHLPPGQATLLRVVSSYESVQLFVERAQAVQKTFDLTSDNVLPVSQICARLEGLPLAIELAAARVKSLTTAQIASRLDDHLSLLTGGSRAGSSRQQTLRGTLDWSYGLLSADERLLLGRLSVFSGGWSLEAAEAVYGGNGIGTSQVLDLLTQLAEKSMLIFDERRMEGRYSFLETVRQYAAEKLSADDAAEQVKARHLDFFLALAEEAEAELIGTDQKPWLERLKSEHSNLRLALEWSGTASPGDALRMEAGLRMAGALSQFWLVRGHYSEGRQFLDRMLEQGEVQIGTAARAKALSGAAGLARIENDYSAAQTLDQQSLEIYRKLGDRQGIAQSLNSLSHAAVERGEYPAAKRLLEESLSLCRELGDRRGAARSLANLGNILREGTDNAGAQAAYEESLGLFREVGDRRNIAWLLMFLGGLARSQRDYASARTRLEESLDLCRELEERRGAATALTSLANLVAEEGDTAAARTLLEESTGIRREMGDKRALAWTLASLGSVTQEQREYASARGILTESLNLFREIGDRRGVATALMYLGGLAVEEADTTLALSQLKESFRILFELQDKAIIAEGLAELATTLLALAHTEDAVCVWGAIHTLRASIGIPLPSSKTEKHTRQVAQAHAALGDDVFNAAWENGLGLTWEQVAAYALGDAVVMENPSG
jgi:predicted ATPase/DNA-binding SARP family transcriptional activator